MATTTIYGSFPAALANKEIDWDSDTIKVMLVTGSYTPSQDTHDYLDDVVANEVSGPGYTAGGATLGSKTNTYNSGTNTRTFDAADVEWPDSTITARYAVVYDATPGTNSTRPLIAYVDFGADRTSSAGLFRIAWHTNGIFTVTV